jgi:hypothetical protein
MIKKIVPLPEHMFAVFKVTFHQLYPPVGTRVLKSDNSKTPCSGNVVFVNPYFTDIDLASVLNVDCHSAWNHVSQRLKLYLA